MKYIKLTQNKFAIVDDKDFEYLNQFRWFYSNKYAKRSIWYPKIKRQKQIRMHNVICKPINDMFVDHINGNTLDNRRENLRICTQTENNRNRKISKNNQSGLKGVSFFKNRWRAIIKRRFIGYFNTKEEAAKAYDNESLKEFGKFSKFNYIKQ